MAMVISGLTGCGSSTYQGLSNNWNVTYKVKETDKGRYREDFTVTYKGKSEIKDSRILLGGDGSGTKCGVVRGEVKLDSNGTASFNRECGKVETDGKYAVYIWWNAGWDSGGEAIKLN